MKILNMVVLSRFFLVIAHVSVFLFYFPVIDGMVRCSSGFVKVEVKDSFELYTANVVCSEDEEAIMVSQDLKSFINCRLIVFIMTFVMTAVSIPKNVCHSRVFILSMGFYLNLCLMFISKAVTRSFLQFNKIYIDDKELFEWKEHVLAILSIFSSFLAFVEYYTT